MRLSKTQKDHIIARIKSVFNSLRNECRTRFPDTEAVELSPLQRFEAYKKGKVKIRPDLALGCFSGKQWQGADAFLLFEGETPYAENEVRKAVQARIDELEERTIDEIILGDASEALNKLRTIETMTFDSIVGTDLPAKSKKRTRNKP